MPEPETKTAPAPAAPATPLPGSPATLIGNPLSPEGIPIAPDKWASQRAVAEVIAQQIHASLDPSLRQRKILGAALIVVVDNEFQSLNLMLHPIPANPTPEQERVGKTLQAVGTMLMMNKAEILIEKAREFFNNLFNNVAAK